MEDDQAGRACDAQQYYYIGRHPGFCGTIKQSPEDFVVIEIDERGRRADADHLTATDGPPPNRPASHPPNPGSPVQAKRPKLERRPTAPAETAARREPPAPAEPPPGDGIAEETESGEQLLPEAFDEADAAPAAARAAPRVPTVAAMAGDVAEALGDLAAAVRAEARVPAGERGDAGCLSLGLFPDKETRAEVHRAVRQRFPFLMTVTAGTEIQAKADPVYAEFRGLVSEEEADGLFRFVDAKRRDATFSFGADADRASRAAVHHAVTRHFGKVLETKSFSEARGGEGGGGQSTRIVARFKERRGQGKKRTGAEVEGSGCERLDSIDGGVYTGFTLQKTNMETLGAISMLASELGVLPSDFSYAGTKDKKAVTFQRMVAQKVTPSRIAVSSVRNLMLPSTWEARRCDG